MTDTQRDSYQREIAALMIEIERLRDALEQIAQLGTHEFASPREFAVIARDALGPVGERDA